ncbi:MAG TPA: LolA-related protein [Stellaceae bacterium]|nr:LolA-related protein [Stellaceae bacterium]
MAVIRFIGPCFTGRRFIGLLLLCVSASLPAPARADAAWSVERLMGLLGQVKTARAHFVDRKYLNMLTQPVDSAGTLVYSAPSRLEKNTLTPKPERLVVEQDKLTIDQADGQHRVVDLPEYPEIWGFVESIRGTLAGDLGALNRFYDVSIEGRETAWQLLLLPRDAKMRAAIQSIRVQGEAAQLQSIEIREADGDRSIMTITQDTP